MINVLCQTSLIFFKQKWFVQRFAKDLWDLDLDCNLHVILYRTADEARSNGETRCGWNLAESVSGFRTKPARLSLQPVRLYNADIDYIDIAVCFASTKGVEEESHMEGCARSIPASRRKKAPTMICQDSPVVLQTPNQISFDETTKLCDTKHK